ncbi:unnamed protein product [Prorocentrum cordatum]|uniref:FACT complex subunit n=1 Tax=Prorocentrum cordatum TaxID=2364126 RepID=A0ABN9W061_9DINO|nr:unnamed protein product [Polarella glacialis]
MKPEQRGRWLNRVLKQVSEGRVKANEVYDLISLPRFTDGIPPKVGRKMGFAVGEKIDVFSSKQQRTLTVGPSIMTKFVRDKGADGDDSGRDEQPAAKRAPEEPPREAVTFSMKGKRPAILPGDVGDKEEREAEKKKAEEAKAAAAAAEAAAAEAAPKAEPPKAEAPKAEAAAAPGEPAAAGAARRAKAAGHGQGGARPPPADDRTLGFKL